MKDKKAAKPRRMKRFFEFRFDHFSSNVVDDAGGNSSIDVIAWHLDSKNRAHEMNRNGSLQDPEFQIKDQDILKVLFGEMVGRFDELFKDDDGTPDMFTLRMFTFSRRRAYDMLKVCKLGFAMANKSLSDDIRSCLRNQKTPFKK